MIVDGIRSASEGRDIPTDTARAIMDEMMAGSATPSQVAAFAVAMRMKGETAAELVGLAQAMRSRAKKVRAPEGAVDLCGTGGDGASTFNISTAASFVVAAAGVPVAKHGNRAISSRAGSADVLSAMGIPVEMDSHAVEECLQRTSLGFMFAPFFHESMRNVMATRREIGVRTFFNILGPLANPSEVRYQLVGVFRPELAPLLVEVLGRLGSERAMAVHGDGLDEISNTGITKVVELDHGAASAYDVSPDTFGVDHAEPEDLRGGTPAENARAMISVLRGERSPRSDVVAMNAGAALYISGRADDLQTGFDLAQQLISDGAAHAKLQQFADTACSLEEGLQKRGPASALASRRMLPATLRCRCGDIVEGLASEVRSLRGGDDALDLLDPCLLSEPTVLSVLVFNRLRRVLGERDTQPAPGGRRAGLSLSEAIASTEGIAVIGEYKPRSPMSPPLTVPPSVDWISRSYSESGVAAASVLVEPDYFDGSPELFADFKDRLDLPVLFKDFVVGAGQVDQAAALGADAVLLVAKALTKDSLSGLVRRAVSKGLEPLVEIHDEEDLDKVTACEAYDEIGIIGINSRDLRSMDIDLAGAVRLRRQVQDGVKTVAESGIRRPEEVASLKGFDAVLIGTMFMQSADIDDTVRRTVAAASGVGR